MQISTILKWNMRMETVKSMEKAKTKRTRTGT